jgi:hypothetical protein
MFTGVTLIEEATMHTTIPQAVKTDRLELVPVPEDGLVITDTAFAHDDPRCLIGYVEESGGLLEVVWVQAPIATEFYSTTADVMAAAAARCIDVTRAA